MIESVDDAGYLAPVAAEAPCGPDLDAEGDVEFMNFMAATEGQLPANFFDPLDGKMFDRKSVDFAAAFAAGEQLLTRTHDVRLLVLLAKLAILNRDLGQFAHWCVALARLLADHWDDAHPRGEDGDFTLRLMQLATLDDNAVVVMPLQYTSLAETQRDGAVSFRAQLAALGEVKPREGENMPGAAAIDRVLLNAEMSDLAKTLQSLHLIKVSIAQIRAISIDRAGFAQAVNFDALSPLVDRMLSFVQAAVARRDPSVAAPELPGEKAPPSDGAPTLGPPPDFASLADVDAALSAALGYFETKEPSSAAVLLIGQARQLLGKNLYDVMRLLAPNYADAARIFVGAEAAFTVPVSGILTNGASAELLESQEVPPAASRAAALALVDSVAAHMRKVEPSSPAPYLLDRAKALASRDFLSLLKDLLPEEALTQMKGGG